MQIVLPFQNNRWLDVEKVASNWVKREPNSAEAWYYLGQAKQHMGDQANAIKHYQQALSLHPNHPATLQATVQIAQKNGNKEQTNKLRLTLQEINPALLEDLDDPEKLE